MARWLIGSGIRLRRVVLALAVVAVSFGVWHLRDLKVDALPEFGPPTVQIQTEAPGLSPAEVEQLITVPLENDLLNGIPWLADIRSTSVLGLSSIDMTFEPGTDLFKARQVVQERLTQAHALPNVSKGPQMIQPLSSTPRTLMIGIGSRTLSPIELGVLARWTIRPRLMGVPGVANVAVWGQRDQQLQVQVDPNRLAELGVTLDQVIRTSGNALAVSQLSFLEASTPGTGGFVDTPNQRLGIEHILPISRPDELAQVPLDGTDAPAGTASLKLGDIATVVQDHQPLIGDAVGPTMMLVVEKLPGANTLDVTRAVDAAVEALKPGLPGVTIDSSLFRPARYVQTSIDNVTLTLMVAGLLLLLALAALLFDWRQAVVSVAAIVCSLAAAVSVLYLRNVTVNAMVLAGLVVGLVIVIDDAADVATLARRIRRREAGAGPAAVVFETWCHLRAGLGCAGLVSAAAVVPLLLLHSGPASSFLPPIVLTYLLAAAASTLVALVVTPALAVVLLSKAPEPGEPPLLRVAHRLHERMLSATLGTTGPAVAVAVVMVLAGAAVLPGLTGSTRPALKDRDVLVHVEAVAGTSLPEMARMTRRIGDELRSMPGVGAVGAQVGRAVTSDTAQGVDAAEIWVTMKPAGPYGATLASIRRAAAAYPGLRSAVTTYGADQTRQILTGRPEPVVVRIFGTDYGVLATRAAEVRSLLAGVKGVVNPRVVPLVQEPTVEVEVDIAAAQRFGVKPGDVRREATALVNGIEVGNIFEDQKVFDVVVKADDATRSSLTGIQNILIDTPGGSKVRLGDLASVRLTSTASAIGHEETKRSMDVTADLGSRGMGAVSADIRAGLRGLAMPTEYHAELLSDTAVRQGADLRVFEFGVAAAIVVFLLLQAAYRSWRLAALAYLVLPVALAGSAVAMRLDGGAVTLGSYVAVLAVLALGARGVVLMIRQYRLLEREAHEAFGPELVLRGTRERLAPTLVTVLGGGLALAPLALRGSIAGLEVIHPVAVTVLGGLVSTAVLTLFVLPALYLRFGSSPFTAPVAEAEGIERTGAPAAAENVPTPDPTFTTVRRQEGP